MSSIKFRARIAVALASFAVMVSAYARAETAAIQGVDLASGKQTLVSVGASKGLVVVFLSALCPCSNSHVKELIALAKDYPQFSFVAVHSNANEEKSAAAQYFKTAALPFAVIQDDGAKIADQYKASKTPHAFILDPSGKIVFRGGVSSSHDFADGSRRWLREAIDDVQNGRDVKKPVARTLGCSIARS